VFLAHFTGGGIPVLDLDVDEFWEYFDEAMKMQEMKMKSIHRIALAGIEK